MSVYPKRLQEPLVQLIAAVVAAGRRHSSAKPTFSEVAEFIPKHQRRCPYRKFGSLVKAASKVGVVGFAATTPSTSRVWLLDPD